jgi:fatty acid desaturase
MKNKPIYRYKIHDKLYDLTDFVKIHPGGQDMFKHLQPDTNITPMIYAYHKNPDNILSILPKYEVLSDMTNIDISYNTNYTYDKYCELKKLVYDEIHEKKISLYWTNHEIIYNGIILSLYLVMWGYYIYNANNLSIGWIIPLSMFTYSWGFLVYHEVSHYAGFKNNKYNLFWSKCYPFTSVFRWKFGHNFLHHSFTDTEYDPDLLLDKSYYIRFINTKLNFIHKFQFIYFNVLWMWSGLGSIKSNYMSLLNSNIFFVCFLFYYIGLYKLVFFYICYGWMFVFFAQLNHVHYECIQLNTENKNDYLYNQVSSAINYKTDLITKCICSGFDVQIEHHLFPNIPHSSLRKIKHIVREYCEKNNIPYVEKSSIY